MKSKTTNLIKVTCGIIIRQRKVLVAQRSEKMRIPLKWEFPGGKIEQDETAEDCLLRELKEELNIEGKLLQKLPPKDHDYGTFAIRLIPFIARYTAGDIILTEHKDFKWVSKDELKSLDWADADRPILDDFLKTDL